MFKNIIFPYVITPILAVIMYFYFTNLPEFQPKQPEQSTYSSFESYVRYMCIKLTKIQMHDPDSFELVNSYQGTTNSDKVEWDQPGSEWSVKIFYSGTNAFNARVRGESRCDFIYNGPEDWKLLGLS